MNAKRFICLIGITAALFTAPVNAQDEPQMAAGDWEVGFGIGATQFDSDLSDDSDNELRSELRAAIS